MKKSFSLSIYAFCLSSFLVFILVGCSQTIPTSIVQTAIAETQMVQPTNTPLPVTIDSLSLQVIQPYDLPAGYSGAQVRDVAIEFYKDVPPASLTYYQELAKDGDEAGRIVIFKYTQVSDADQAYHVLLEYMEEAAENKSFDGVGEKAYGADVIIGPHWPHHFMFLRCSSVIHIVMKDLVDYDSILGYAKRLDNRLQTFFCQ